MNNGFFTEKQIVVDNVLLTYYLHPSTISGETYVFLHGWGSNSTLWFAAVGPVIQNRTALFLDLPGFGKSQIPTQSWGLDEYVAEIADFFTKLNLKKVTLVGHSFGGAIAIKLAVNRPDLIAKLILVDSAGIRPKTVRKNMITGIAKIVKPLFQPEFMRPIKEKIYRCIGAEDYLDPRTREIYTKIISEDLTGELSRVKQQTFLIWGENDRSTPPADAEIMHRSIKNSTLAVIPGAGHFSFLDQPHVFQKIMAKDLEKI
jgi:pimeloyl-ACP methyl ester carboxylesterase